MLWNLSIYSSFLEQQYPVSDVEGENWMSALKSELHHESLNGFEPENLTSQVEADQSVRVTDRESMTTYLLTPIERPSRKGRFR
jgi:hypothetical protein